jgi:hypothetical protein
LRFVLRETNSMRRPERYFLLAPGIGSAVLAIGDIAWWSDFEETQGVVEIQPVDRAGKTHLEPVVVFEGKHVSRKYIIHDSESNPLSGYHPGDRVRVLYRPKHAEIWNFWKVWGRGLGLGVLAALLLGFGLFSRSRPDAGAVPVA